MLIRRAALVSASPLLQAGERLRSLGVATVPESLGTSVTNQFRCGRRAPGTHSRAGAAQSRTNGHDFYKRLQGPVVSQRARAAKRGKATEQLWAKTPQRFVTDPTLGKSARRLYVYLDLRAGERAWFYAEGGQREIAEDTGMSVATIRRATRELEAGGYISTLRTIELRTALKYFVLFRLGRTPDDGPIAGRDAEQLVVDRERSRSCSRERSERQEGANRSGQGPTIGSLNFERSTRARFRSGSEDPTGEPSGDTTGARDGAHGVPSRGPKQMGMRSVRCSPLGACPGTAQGAGQRGELPDMVGGNAR